MGFLTPWFLAGLGLLGVPVYLHLLKRHRSETQQFASLMFFEKSVQADLKHRRLDYLLLLAARLFLLTLMVLAFAQPFLWRAGGAGAAAERLVVVDTSASMGFAGRMQKARDEAAPLVRQGARLAAFDSKLRLLTAADLAGLEAAGSRNSFGELARALRGYQQNLKRPVEVHLISDLQRSAMPAGFSDLRLNGDLRLVLHPLAEKAAANWAVESVTAPARVRDGRGARIQATVAGFHTEAARKSVSLEVNGKTVATKSVDVPPAGRVKVEFEGPEIPYGFSRCAVVMASGDGLAMDDRHWFAMERTDPRRVVFLGSPRAELYVKNALEAAAAGAYTVVRSDSFQDAAFVIVADAVPADAAFTEYLRRGGAALVAVGPVIAASSRVPGTGQRILGSKFATRDGERFLALGATDASYVPLARAGQWEGVRFYQVFEVEPGQARVYARLASSLPVLMEQSVGAGSVMVLASGLDNLGNDLPVHPGFVPFLEQAAHRLSGWQQAALDVAVDTAIDFPAGASRSFEALDPEGRRAMTLEESAKGAPLVLTRTGFWEVRRGAGRSQMIAANVDGRESDLEPMPKESAELWSGGAAQEGTAGVGQEQVKRSLAIWVLAAAVLAAAVEAYVASKHLSQEAA